MKTTKQQTAKKVDEKTLLNEVNNLNFENIFDAVTENEVATAIPNSMQGTLCKYIIENKIDALTENDVKNFITKNTILKPTTFKNWFTNSDEAGKYKFADYIDSIKVDTPSEHKSKYNTFYTQMSKKTFDLVFNDSYIRKFESHDWFENTGIEIDRENKLIGLNVKTVDEANS